MCGQIFCPKEIEEALDVKVSGGDLVLRLNTDRLDRKERRNFRGGVRAVVSIPRSGTAPTFRSRAAVDDVSFSKAPILSWGLAAHRRRPG